MGGTKKKKKDDAVWEDCGCPLSMTIGDFAPDVAAIASLPHMCTISPTEFHIHYVFDRGAFQSLIDAPPNSPLRVWTQQRCNQERMFVARPPTRPTLPPAPWRDDAPEKNWTLPRGWRHWAPTNAQLNFSDENSVEDYQMSLDSFFLYLNIKDPVQQARMREGIEAWTMACGDALKGKHSSIHDRCFVTSSGELFAYLLAAGDQLNNYLKDLKLSRRPRHLRRLADLQIDAKVKIGHAFNP
jgi:hypothetical protein